MGLFDGIAGSVLGGAADLYGQRQSYKNQVKLLEKEQAFEREKAQNYHQWEVQDLQNAGLNPILSAGSSVNLGSPSAPTTASPDLGRHISAAAERRLEKERIKNQKTLMDAQGKQAVASAKQAESNAKKAETEEKILRAQARAESPKLKQQEKYNKSKIGSTLNYIGMGARDIQPAVNILGTGAMLYGGGRMLGTANAVKKSVDKLSSDVGRKFSGRLIQQAENGKWYSISGPTAGEWVQQPTFFRGQMRYPHK